MANRRKSFEFEPKLFLAFGALAGVTVVTSIAACVLLAQIGGMLTGVAQKDIPAVIGSLRLQAQTQALAAAAPAMPGVDTEQRREQQRGLLRDEQNEVAKNSAFLIRCCPARRRCGRSRR